MATIKTRPEVLKRTQLKPTRTDVSRLGDIEPRFASAKVPLTRHMYMCWERWNHSHRFHLNSDKSRIEFITFYIYELMPGRSFQTYLKEPRIVSALNASVDAWGPMTAFLHEVWKRHFSYCDLRTEHGYFEFLCKVACDEFPNRSIPQILLPSSILNRLHESAPGYDGPFISRVMWGLWNSSDLYRSRYNLHDWSERDSYALDFLLHYVFDKKSFFLLSPDVNRYWSAKVDTGNPKLTRFGLALASFSRRFEDGIHSGQLSVAQSQEITKWLQSEVLSDFPAYGALMPGLSGAASSAIFDDDKLTVMGNKPAKYPKPGSRNEEIDVLLIGPVGAASGLGAGMRRSVGATEKAGVSFRVLPSYYDNPSFQDSSLPEDIIYRGEKPKITLWHYNGEYLPEVMVSMPDFVKDTYNIGYFFWETEAMPKAHELACDMVDEIWAPSAFCERCYDGWVPHVENVGSSVELPKIDHYLSRKELGLPDDKVIIMFSFDSHSVIHRKNPAAVARSFLKAFPSGTENVLLVLKTQNMATAHWNHIRGRGEELLELCASDPRILLFDQTMTLQELYSLKNACDIYMSLHRSEGFGYGPAEAMALGKPVIMTNYSANTEFGGKGNCMLVDGPLIHVLHDEYLYTRPEMVWCDPDVSQAAEMLRELYESPALREKIGRRAAETITRDFGVDAMAEKYAKRLRELGLLA